MAADYENKVAPARICFACGHEFAPLECYVSALFEAGEEFQRRDYCHRCWQGPPEGSFSYWRGRIPPREEPAQRFVDEGELLELFGRLEGVTELRQVAFRYLLGLLLVRKRLLRPKGSAQRRADSEAGGRVMLVEEAGGGATYEVAVPRLSQAELNEVSARMGAVLRMEAPAATENEKEDREDV